MKAKHQKKLKNINVLIFGGLGFIGRNLTIKLIGYGANVKIVDKRVSKNDISVAKKINDLQLAKGDIASQSFVNKTIGNKTDIIFNLSGSFGPKISHMELVGDIKTTLIGAHNVLNAVRASENKAVVVFLGSRLEYGRVTKLPVRENYPVNPDTFYAANKFAAERYHAIYHKLYGVKTVSIRATNPYGPHIYNPKPTHNIINFFIDKALRNETIEIHGSGRQLKDYIFIEDFCDGLIRAALNTRAYGGVFNIGYGEGISLYDAAKKIVEIAGQGRVEKVPMPDEYKNIGDSGFISDISKIKKTGWRPVYNFNSGIKRTLEIQTRDSLEPKLLFLIGHGV